MAVVGAAIAAAGAWLATPGIGMLVGRLLLSTAVSAISSAIQKQLNKPVPPGIKTDFTTSGGDKPQTFVLGWYATDGHMVCPPMSHGRFDDWSNAYLTYVIDLGNVPGAQIDKVFIDDTEVTFETVDQTIPQGGVVPSGQPDWWYQLQGIDPSAPNAGTALRPLITPGRPVAGYPSAGHEKYATKIWLRYHDGRQSTADQYLMQVYGPGTQWAEKSKRPWTPEMVGVGTCYAVLTFRYSTKSFNGLPRCRFVMRGTPLYDPRKDSSAGGSGPQRWDDPATWATTTNGIVLAYNVLRGIPIAGGPLWGYGVPASALSFSVWAPAMTAADQQVDGKPRWQAAWEVSVGEEPATVLDEVLKVCCAKVAESAGRWLVRVGPPAAPVMFFSDDDLILEEDATATPFPGLEATYNAVHASYPEPGQLWRPKDAPPRYNAGWEAADQNRRLVAELNMSACPWGDQVQRVMRAYIEEERRFRRHVFTLPPDAEALEPLDVIAWSSAEQGYDAKLFEVVEVAENPDTLRITVSVTEVDPVDYDWRPDFKLPSVIAPVTVPVAAPAVPGFFNAEGIALSDSAGRARRPAARLRWGGWSLDDITAVEWELRRVGQSETAHGVMGSPELGETIVDAGIVPLTDYEARIRFVANERDVAWTLWKSFRTPDVRIPLVEIDDTPPGKPAPVTLTASVDRITATWPSVGADTAYSDLEVIQDGGNPIWFQTGGLRYEFTPVIPGATYSVRRREVDRVGNKGPWSDAASIIAARDTVPPAAPTGLKATGTFGAIWVEWNRNSDEDFAYYEVAAGAATNPTAVVGRPTSAAFVLNNLADNTKQFFRIRAVDTSGNISGWSSVMNATTKAAIDTTITTDKLKGLVDTTSLTSGVELLTTWTGTALPTSRQTETLTWQGRLYRWDGAKYVPVAEMTDLTFTNIMGALPKSKVATDLNDFILDQGQSALVDKQAAEAAATVANTARDTAVEAKDAANVSKQAAAASATQASQSKNDAAGSASSASTSATAAAKSATLAGQKADAASGFASTATTKASEAGQFATAAAGSATVASTKAGEASTSATAAAQSKADAAGSANTAGTFATNSATSLTEVQRALANTSAVVSVQPVAATKSFGYTYAGLPADYSTAADGNYGSDADGAYLSRAGTAVGLATLLRSLAPTGLDSVYRVTVRVKATAALSIRITGAFVAQNGSHSGTVTVPDEAFAAGEVRTLSVVVGRTAGGLVTTAAGTVANWTNSLGLRFGVITTAAGPAGATYQVYEVRVDDLTGADAAARKATDATNAASAASDSASTASTKATDAGQFASASSAAANTASTQAGIATAKAGDAAQSATAAAGSASEANSYANLAALALSGGIAKNPVFLTWTGSIPENVGIVGGSVGTVSKIEGKYGNAIELNVTGTSATGPYVQLSSASINPAQILVTAEVELVSGTASGASIEASWKADGTWRYASKLIGAGLTVGAIQTVQIALDRPAAATNADQIMIRLFSSHTAAGGVRSVCKIKVHRFDAQEILSGSFVDEQRRTKATVDGISESAYVMRVKAGGAAAGFEMVAANNPNGPASAIRMSAQEILLDGSVKAPHLDAGAITARTMAIGFGGNFIGNSSFSMGVTGWQLARADTAGTESIMAIRLPPETYTGVGSPTLMIRQNGTSTSGYADLRYLGVANNTGALGLGWLVSAGDWLEASVQLSQHRCTTQLRIEWRAEDGTVLDRSSSATTVGLPSGSSNNPDTWPRIWVKGKAPAGAAYGLIHLRKLPTESSTDSYLFVHKPMLAASGEFRTEPTPYAPGSFTYLDGSGLITDSVTARAVNLVDLAASGLANLNIAYIRQANISGKLTADILEAGSALAGNITVNGTALNSTRLDATLGAREPAARVNEGSVRIDPGKIVISGGTTLSDWRKGGDETRIDGGNISANTVAANKMEIGSRNITLTGIQFEHNKPSTNQVSWTGGRIVWVTDTGPVTSTTISAGSATWSSGVLYIYWAKGATSFSTTTSLATAMAVNNVCLATYEGDYRLDADYGRTVIDGDMIKLGTLEARHLVKTQALITEAAQLGNAVIKSASIGDLEVDTIKLKSGSLSSIWATSMAGSAIGNPDPLESPNGRRMGGLSFTPFSAGSRVLVVVNYTSRTTLPASAPVFRLVVNGNLHSQANHPRMGGITEGHIAEIGLSHSTVFTAAAGTNTVEVYGYSVISSASLADITLSVQEIKR